MPRVLGTQGRPGSPGGEVAGPLARGFRGLPAPGFPGLPARWPSVLPHLSAAEPRVALKAEAEPRRTTAPPKIDRREVTRALDRFVAGRGGRVTAMVKDLQTGRTYRYNRGLRLPTASTSKVDILMALLLKASWRKLPSRVRRDADIMIRYSDNMAADRLWVRIGGPYGLAKANERFRLRHTVPGAGRCVDLYCWGITRTSAEDQVRLMSALVDEDSPLEEDERERVLWLMTAVIKEQKWGISAAACKGETVALKNGWLRHVSNDLWAVVSAGLIRGRDRDYAVAVLTEDSPTVDAGIAKVEGTAGRIMAAFRGVPYKPGKRAACPGHG